MSGFTEDFESIGDSGNFRTGTSLIAHLSFTTSSARDTAAPPSDPHREGTDGAALFEKAFRELLRDGVVTTPGEGRRRAHGFGDASAVAASSDRIEHRWDPLQETDGGVRLAGGRAGDGLDAGDIDQYSGALAGSTLPPPYYRPSPKLPHPSSLPPNHLKRNLFHIFFLILS